MNIKTAIPKAIEGGWKESSAKVTNAYEGISMQSTHKALLDPKFWQALGKSEGWGVYPKGYFVNSFLPEKEWKERQLQCIENIQQDQSLDEAFNNATN